jgi:hypothetical protein
VRMETESERERAGREGRDDMEEKKSERRER